jgi:serine/threonine protein kinase
MTPERWQQVRSVLEKALELAPGQRSAYLNQACPSDSSLRQEVETLLASSDHVRSNFLHSAPASVALTPGDKLGEYEIVGLLGSGGMGEVYRARDARLDREVAIKVLPVFFAADSDRLRRFEQEARAAAALNHPNILAVFQMGTHEGAPYLVSELLEGEALRDQLKRGRLVMRKAIDYGVQIARGLAAAHEKGIVHRDLKPENLFVTKDGRVKILDFGLAKLMQRRPSSDPSAPTFAAETEAGAVMGTVGYMAPEQVRGDAADHRADIFAFGAILYEMLAGKRAFQKPTSPETMTAILNEDPAAISQVTTNIAPALQRVVHRCLEKNPEQRFQSASDLAFALDALSETSGASGVTLNKESRKISKLWVVAAVLVAAVAAGLWLRFRTTPRPEPKHELAERQLTANPPENSISSQAISRDGKYLAYTDFLSKNLHLLAIDSGEIRQLPLPDAYQPIDWFPDGSHLLMSGANGDLWKMSTWDSGLRRLWGSSTSGAALSADGSRIAFVKDGRELWTMGGDGEEPRKILAIDTPDYQAIAWSPTGQRLAYLRIRGTFGKAEVTIETCDLSGGAPTAVLSDPRMWSENGTSGIAWAPDGRILYSIFSSDTESSLWARMTDPSTGKPSGDATRLAGWKNFTAWSPQASADGKRLIAVRLRIDNGIYIGDLASGSKRFTPHRFTPDGWYNIVGTWTHDGKAILLSTKRNGRWTISKQDIDSKTPETLIAGSENYFSPVLSSQGALLYTATASPDWARDGTARLMTTPEHGGARSTLMVGSHSYRCGYSPLSRCVVSELKDRRLVFFDLDPVKGGGEELAHIADYQGFDPSWDLSPDGAKLAIVDRGQGKGEIRILNLADRKVTVMAVRDSKWQSLPNIRWAADGKSLFAHAQSASSWALLLIDASGNPRVLYEIPVGAGWVDSIVPSPDGRSLAFTKRTYVNDVMLLESF